MKKHRNCRKIACLCTAFSRRDAFACGKVSSDKEIVCKKRLLQRQRQENAMKNRIWRRIRKTGIAVATAGAVLSGGFLTETVKSAEIEAVGITIGQSGSWTDKENGRAELNIHVEGIKRWIDERKKQEAEALEVKNMQLEDVTAKIAEVKNMEQNTW